MPYNVLTLVGGISSTSINKRLFAEMVKANDTGLRFTMFDIASLPFFSQDIELTPPAAVMKLKEMARAADAVLIVTPEYNRSIPGVLKNALDWGSRPPADNCWNGKPAAISGASSGAIGTFGAQQHLRNICSSLNMHVMSQPEAYINFPASADANGLNERSVAFIRKFLGSFEQWIGTFK